MTFSFIREIILRVEYGSPFYIHIFNQFARLSDYYGEKNEKLDFIEMEY